MRLIFISALAVFIIDQVTKLVIVHYLGLKDSLKIDIFPPFLNFRMGWNTGLNFGLFSDRAFDGKFLFILIAVLISTGLFLWGAKNLNQFKSLIAVGFIIGGAIGNAFDRLLYGAVADFINMSCCSIQNPYTFNVADSFIFVGIGLLLFVNEQKTA
ncbi:MAG: signal peptidase II [Paracoccaceae bacterium]|jgi:signal peptidase II